jgi:hypothetical protein
MAAPGGPTPKGTPVSGTVTVMRGSAQGHLGPGFVGMSYEKTHMTDGYLSASNAPLVALFQLLGPSILRLGGNSVDLTSWSAGAAPGSAGKVATTIGTADVDALAGFMTAAGWTALYGVNMGTNTPATAAEEAKYAAGKLGTSLYGFEIGNEITKFGTYATVKTKWDSLATAMKASVSGAQFTGPGVYGAISTYVVPFAHDEASNIVLLTDHYYLGAPSVASISAMLADTKLLGQAQAMQAATTPNHIRDSWRFGEASAYFDHGVAGVSDTLAAALWSIDFMLTSAQYGASGVNFHGGGTGQDLAHLNITGFPATPIAEANSAVTGTTPLFHGMLFVTRAGSGDLYPATVSSGSVSLSAYAVALADGSTNVILVNKDATADVSVSLDAGSAASTSCALYLQGSSQTATTVTFGGATVSGAGTWTPAAPVALTPSGGKVTVLVPASSAALVHVQ